MDHEQPLGRSRTTPITDLLHAAAGGDREALNRVLPLVYRDLSGIARQRLRREPSGTTLNTTALVHEAYLKLASQDQAAWQNREHFFAVASEAMRRILIDHARKRQAEKRGNGRTALSLDAADRLPADLFTDAQTDELVALDDALERLAKFNPRGARVVQYRFFGGLSTDEIARVLLTSERTVRRSWAVARAWLHHELDVKAGPTAGSLLAPDLG